MPLVKYIASPAPDDRTEEIRLSEGRSLKLNGDAIEVSDKELLAITANGYQLEVADKKEVAKADEAKPVAHVEAGTPSPLAQPASPTPLASPGA